MNNVKKILVLAPHTDDAELGCGGTIARFINEGKEVFCFAFSNAKQSLENGFSENVLKEEFKKASSILGIKEENTSVFDFPVRRFPINRQDILEKIIELRDRINPDLVFVPSLTDIHQDHKTIAEESLRAFKCQTILGYEQPWNNIVFETRCFIPLGKEHIDKKVKALNCYQSQKHRSYLKDDFMWSLARTRGVQIEGEYAEAFEILRWVFDKN